MWSSGKPSLTSSALILARWSLCSMITPSLAVPPVARRSFSLWATSARDRPVFGSPWTTVTGFPHLRNSTLIVRWVSLLSSSFSALLKSNPSLNPVTQDYFDQALVLFGDFQEPVQVVCEKLSILISSHVFFQTNHQVLEVWELA